MANDNDIEANWEKIIINFKKELDVEKEQLKPKLSSDMVNNSEYGDAFQIKYKARAKFFVSLSSWEMKKEFEDIEERQLSRKPKKQLKSLQNQLELSISKIILCRTIFVMVLIHISY